MKTAPAFLLAALLLWAFALSVPGQIQLTWNAPTNQAPAGYVVFHGTQPGAYTDLTSAGPATNLLWTATLPFGLNYFAVTAFYTSSNSGLQMSQWSNIAVVTNTAAIAITSVLLTSTSLNGHWTPAATNRMIFTTSSPQQFYRLAAAQAALTNLLTFPPQP